MREQLKLEWQAECVEQVTLPSDLAPDGSQASRGHHSSRQNRHNVIRSGGCSPIPTSCSKESRTRRRDRKPATARVRRSSRPLIVLSLAADHIEALTRFHVTISIRKLRLPAFVQGRSLTGDR